eukprot:6214586-Pleurochrysis_carterae.AAC.1
MATSAAVSVICEAATLLSACFSVRAPGMTHAPLAMHQASATCAGDAPAWPSAPTCRIDFSSCTKPSSCRYCSARALRGERHSKRRLFSTFSSVARRQEYFVLYSTSPTTETSRNEVCSSTRQSHERDAVCTIGWLHYLRGPFGSLSGKANLSVSSPRPNGE